MGVSCREGSLFITALREVFDPLQSPRYLLVTRDEEFAVPRVFAERKERAESPRIEAPAANGIPAALGLRRGSAQSPADGDHPRGFVSSHGSMSHRGHGRV